MFNSIWKTMTMASLPLTAAFAVQRIFIMISILSATALFRASAAATAAAGCRRRPIAFQTTLVGTHDVHAKQTLPTMPSSRLLKSSSRQSFAPSRSTASANARYQLQMSSSATSSSRSSATETSSNTSSSSLVGINTIRTLVADTLNEIFIDNTEQSPPSPPHRYTLRDAMVTPATKPEFGDYQCNAAMSLSKKLGYKNPRECAQQIVNALQPKLDGIMELPLEIAGPGFINLKLDNDYLSKALGEMALDSAGRLAVPLTDNKKKVVVDFSSPNIAKEMHVGHLRSTIIGDTLSNVLTFAGHDVLRLNHVGDWGTQFGMLVEHLRDEYPEALLNNNQDVDLGDLVTLYKAAKKRFDVDEEFKARAREGVVKLQAGDAESLAAWESLCRASRVEYQKIYDRLNIVGLNERGESFYNPYLEGVVTELQNLGLAVESEGATAVFLEGYANRDGSPLPMLVRKSDGGFNYATTDLAAVRHRVQFDPNEGGEKADRVLYVTDAGQSQHFEMVFAAAKKAGFVPDTVSLEHVPFGLVQGEDGKKFATRSGDTVKLKDLLDEAVRIAGDDIKSRMDDDTELTDALSDVAKTVGIGAVKYADLSMNRESNYKFSYGRMLSLNGNTAPYMLYAYARICGIVRKATGQSEGDKIIWPEAASTILITHDSEKQLVRNLVKLPDILSEVEMELYPNRLCDYLFETSQKFNQFYESCSVNNAETPELKASRLTMCTVSAATIRLLMGLLGIPVVEKL